MDKTVDLKKNLEAKLDQLGKWKSQYDVAKDMFESVQEEVTDLMSKLEMTFADAPTVQVEVSTVVSSRFDTAKFKIDNDSLYKKYLRTSSSTRVKVTLK